MPSNLRRFPRSRWAAAALAIASACPTAQDATASTAAPPAPAAAPSNPAPIGTPEREIGKSAWYVFQARNNTYWFGGDDGVYRYDGRVITHFTTKDGLPGNRIRGIQEDKSGNIFFTTFEGISKFDGRRFTTLPLAEGCDTGKAWKLDPDDLWFQWFRGMPGKDGPYRYDGTSLYHLTLPKSDREDAFNAANPRPPSSPYDIYCIYKDRRGHMWFGTANLGLCRYDGKSWKWIYEEHLTTVAANGGSFGIRSIIEDNDGTFWICNTRHRYTIDQAATAQNETNLVSYTRVPGIPDLKAPGGDDFYFMSVVQDSKGDLWMASYGAGVWRYDGKTVTRYRVMDAGTDTRVFSVYKDNQSTLWLGTHEAGPYKFNGTAFEPFRP